MCNGVCAYFVNEGSSDMPLYPSTHTVGVVRRVAMLLVLLAVVAGGPMLFAIQPQASVTLYLPLIARPGTGSIWVSAYYVGYQHDMLPADGIDWSTLTHLMVGRIRPTPSGGIATDFDIDAVQGPQMARDLAQGAHAAGRKAILMLGGAGEHAGFVGAAAALVDQINIMSYDMAGAWDGWDSWLFGPLYGATPTHPSSIDSSVQRFLAVGVPAHKLGIGVGFYGSC